MEGEDHPRFHQRVHRGPDALGAAELLSVRAALREELEAGEGVGAQHDCTDEAPELVRH